MIQSFTSSIIFLLGTVESSPTGGWVTTVLCREISGYHNIQQWDSTLKQEKLPDKHKCKLILEIYPLQGSLIKIF